MSTKLTRRTLVAGAAIASAGAASAMAGAAEPDPIFAALERCRVMEAICDQEAAGQTSPDDDLEASASEALEARMALALTVPTTWAGLATLIGFVAERSAWYDDFYFQDDEAVPYALSLAKAITQL